MMRKRIILSATWAALLASGGCLRDVCERHGYYPTAPAAYTPQCCVPCCPPPTPTAGYVAPTSSWNAPAAAVPATCPAGCVPAAR